MTDAMRLDQKFVELFNARKWDELGTMYYAEDAIAAPPNHEPIQGRDAIIQYMRESRDALGELQDGPDTFKASVSGSLVCLVAKFAVIPAASGQLPTSCSNARHGSLKCTVEMFGIREPAV